MNPRRFLSQNKIISAGFLIVMILTISVLVVSIQPPKSVVVPSVPTGKAQFVLASWDYPDEYGQGIYGFRFYENSTGSWVAAPWYYLGGELDGLPFYFLNPDSSYTLNWSEGVAMKLRVYSTFNNTVMEADDEADGQNYQRHNVSVTSAGVAVFNQNNFTYYDVTPDGEYWAYEYEMILNFLPVGGAIYMVAITYELWTPSTADDTILTASSGSTDAGTPTGTYTDTHTVNGVFFGGSDIVVINTILWVEYSEVIGGFNYSAYWNASHVAEIYIYNHNISDWALLDDSPNGEDCSVSWDNDTVTNTNYWNTTNIGFKFYSTVADGGNMSIDYFQIQTTPTPQWQVIGDAGLLFSVAFDEWGMNTALIILGLVMIPVSTIYLAYGAKHDRSSDRLFYGLIILFLGFGLFIGGIMP